MKTKSNLIFIIILCAVLLPGCGKHSGIEGTYYSINNDYYIIISQDGTIKSNWIDGYESGDNKYKIDNNNRITGIESPNGTWSVGTLYKNYICSYSKWEGKMSNEYEDMTLSIQYGNTTITVHFKSDKTYESFLDDDGTVYGTETGTYVIENNEIISTSTDGMKSIFVDIDGEPYSVEYIKEE